MFIKYEKNTGKVTAFQVFPKDKSGLTVDDDHQVAQISDDYEEALIVADNDGVELVFKDGKLQ